MEPSSAGKIDRQEFWPKPPRRSAVEGDAAPGFYALAALFLPSEESQTYNPSQKNNPKGGRNMKTTLTAVAAAVSAALLAACAMNIPQTRAEFTAHPQILKDTYTVPRALDAVAASLDQQAKRCINEEVRTTGGRIVGASHDVYYLTVEKTSPRRAEMSYRWMTNNTVGMPKGGFYRLAADLEGQGKSTKVTIYHGGSQDSFIKAIKEWTRGNTDACHGAGGKK